jgi:hypothetical protein
MTKQRPVKNAQDAFIAALDVGVEEDSLIEATPEQELLRPPESLSAKEFLDSLAQYEQNAVLSAICYRAGLKI